METIIDVSKARGELSGMIEDVQYKDEISI
jgi:hypothetical protein